MTYGDAVGNVDINDLIKFHKAHGQNWNNICIQLRSK